jgi:hypothetical protein
MTDDVVLMPANEPTIRGAGAMRAWLQRGHQQFNFDVRNTDAHVDVAGDWQSSAMPWAAPSLPRRVAHRPNYAAGEFMSIDANGMVAGASRRTSGTTMRRYPLPATRNSTCLSAARGSVRRRAGR